MYGYVKPYTEELRVKEAAFYRATYCGICREMRRTLGELSGLTLTYDSVFLALVRMVYLPDEAIRAKDRRCALHPFKKRRMLEPNDALSYTARVFALLSYHKCLDDGADERGAKRAATTLAKPFLSSFAARAGLPETLGASIASQLSRITALEREECVSVDALAAPFGELLAEVFSYGMEGDDALVLSTLGRWLGRFIYCADAAEDYGEDVKKGRFNPYAGVYGGRPLDAKTRASIHTALSLMIVEMERAVDLLPFGKRKILEALVHNIVSLGLYRRIDFLLCESDAEAENDTTDTDVISEK